MWPGFMKTKRRHKGALPLCLALLVSPVGVLLAGGLGEKQAPSAGCSGPKAAGQEGAQSVGVDSAWKVGIPLVRIPGNLRLN